MNGYLHFLREHLKGERDTTARHVNFLIHTTDPKRDMKNDEMRARWREIYEHETELIDELCYSRVKVEIKNGTVLFCEVDGSRSDIMHKYISGNISNLNVGTIETLLSVNKKMNAAYEKVISFVVAKNK